MPVKGLDKLNAKLKRLRTETAKAVQPAVIRAAEEVIATQKRLAPVALPQELGRGDLPGALRDDIHWVEAPGGKRTNETRIAIVAGGAESNAPYASFVEFGTSSMRAQPFFYPGYRATRRQARNIIAAAVRKVVKAAAS